MEHHTKIHLSLKDIKHLQSQFTKSALEKVNLYLPTTDSNDYLKTRVLQLINDFIYEILEDAKFSLDIDGIDPQKDTLRTVLENPENETEPFDFSLHDDVRKLYQQVEEETIKLTKLRREAPLNLKRKYEETFENSISRLKNLNNSLEEENDESQEEDRTLKEKETDFERNVKARLDDIIDTYEMSIKNAKDIREVSSEKHIFTVFIRKDYTNRLTIGYSLRTG